MKDSQHRLWQDICEASQDAISVDADYHTAVLKERTDGVKCFRLLLTWIFKLREDGENLIDSGYHLPVWPRQ